MSIGTVVLGSLERRLPKVIDARTHGVIDYCQAAFFFGMALVCRKKNKKAAKAAWATGAFILAESLLTDYPMGAAKVVPFATHGRMDAGLAATSFMIPGWFGFSGTAEAQVFRINGFVEGIVAGMTDWESGRGRALESTSRFDAD